MFVQIIQSIIWVQTLILAEFRTVQNWGSAAVEAAARVSRLSDGRGELRIEAASSSAEFKFFAEPHAAVVVADSAGNFIAEEVITDLAMGSYRSIDRKHRASRVVIDSQKFDRATYAFFKLKFCAWRLGFDRSVKENNGCYWSSMRRELEQFRRELPRTIQKGFKKEGQRFEVLGWSGARLQK
jgi:hypothetical protein